MGGHERRETMSYRLINANEIAIKYPEVNDMPCVFADLPNGLHGQFIDEAPHWVPCSERLPDNIPMIESYIVTVSVDGALFVDKAYSFGTYIDGFWNTVNDWDEGNDVHVLAWMPMPKPYEGADDI
jgi:hypothetical protein